jgi:hypothetical protein
MKDFNTEFFGRKEKSQPAVLVNGRENPDFTFFVRYSYNFDRLSQVITTTMFYLIFSCANRSLLSNIFTINRLTETMLLNNGSQLQGVIK